MDGSVGGSNDGSMDRLELNEVVTLTESAGRGHGRHTLRRSMSYDVHLALVMITMIFESTDDH